MAEGAEFSIDLAVKAEGVASAADLLDVYAQRLTVATQAADAASAAVRAQQGTYTQAEAAYDRASKALERIGIAMQGASGPALERLQQKQSDAAVAANAAREEMERQAVALDTLRVSAIAAQQQVDALTDAEKAAKQAIAEETKSKQAAQQANEKLASGLGALGGPLGKLGQKVFAAKGGFDKLQGVLGAAGPYAAAAIGFAAVAAAVVAVTAVVIKGAIELGQWALGLANARRSSELLYAGLVQSAQGGRELNATVNSLSNRVPLTADELKNMAKQLADSGLRGRELTDKLEETAIAAAKVKFGPEWQREMLSLDQQQKRLKAGVSNLFSGLKIEKLLEGLSTLVDLFDENTASGKAIKVVFESIFQPLVDGATGMIPKIRSAFIQFEILALKALIAIKPWGSTMLMAAKVVGVLAAVLVGVLVVAVGVVVGALAGLALMIAGPIALFAALVAGVIYAGQKIFDFGKMIVTTLSNVNLVDLGKDMIAGFVRGIITGGEGAIAAITNVASNAIAAGKKALGIASPSKVFAEIGMHTAAGMEQGIEGGASGVQGAVENMVAPPAAPSAAPSAAPAATSGGAVYQITINAQGGNAESIAEAVRRVILEVTQGAAVQIGAAAPAGA